MALKNVLTSGSYGSISAALIDKANKNVQFKFEVFSDETKTNLLFAREFFLSCAASYPKMIVDRLAPTGEETAADYFFVPMNATGAWAQFAGKFLQVMDNGNGFEFFPIESTPGSMIQGMNGKVYLIGSGRELIEQVAGTVEIWNAFFAFDVSTAPNTNLIKQCYAFLKTIPLCSGAVDV